MATIISISNRKGGVGKTTTATTLATWLAQHGRRVALVDLDPQGHAAAYLGLDPASSVFKVLVTGADVAGELAPWREDGRLCLLRGDSSTGDARTLLTVKGASPAQALRPLFDPLRKAGFDFVIVDTAPAEDLATLFNADHVLSVVQCEYGALDGLRQLSENITRLREDLKAKTRLIGIVPMMFDGSNEHTKYLGLLADTYGRMVYPPVHKRTVLREAVSAGQPIWEYAPTSPAAQEFETMIRRLLKDLGGNTHG